MDYLCEATKFHIEHAVAANYEDFSDFQKEKNVDFVIQDSFYTYLHDQQVKSANIASVISPEGKIYDPGFFIDRDDSGIKELSDIKGKTLLFRPKANAAKYLAAYILLKRSQIDVEKDITYEFGGLCPHNAMSVFHFKTLRFIYSCDKA